MEERHTDTFVSSANAAAETADELAERYQRDAVVDPAMVDLLATQADQALALARVKAIGSLAITLLQVLTEMSRMIDALKLEGPALQTAMGHMEELTRRLREDLTTFSLDDAPSDITSVTVPVQIYVDETAAGPVVERGLRDLLSEIGIVALTGPEPVIGSWYRKLFGTIKDASGTHTGQELRRAAEIQLIDRYQAGIDGTTAGAVSTMIAALANTRGAVIQAGSVLLVKVDDKIVVRQLTPEQLVHWNENPSLFTDPAAALTELQRAMEPTLNRHDSL